MRTKKRFNLRIISSALCVCFLAGELHAAPIDVLSRPSFAEQILQNPELFEAPSQFSTLTEIHRGNGNAFIIHIQDAHSNFSGQDNLANTLDNLMKKYGVSLVLSEGGYGDCTLTPIKSIATPEVWKRVARSFLMSGKIQGEEYLNLTSEHPMKIVGIEDKGLYDKSVDAYGALVDKRDAVLTNLEKTRRAVQKLKNKFYPQNLKAYEISKKSDAGFEKSFDSFLALVSSAGLSLGTFAELEKLETLREKEKAVNFDLANLEQAALVEEIHQKGGRDDLDESLKQMEQMKGNKIALLTHFRNSLNIAKEKGVEVTKFQNLLGYVEYLSEFSRIDFDKLLPEYEQAEDALYASALDTDDARLVRSVDRFVELLVAAHEIKMTADQYALLKANEADFHTESMEAFLNRKLAENGYFDDILPAEPILDEGRDALDSFYASVKERDSAFIKNAGEILQKEGQKIAFLITGGYHTPHLKQLFREKGYGYSVLTPMVTAETNQKKYEALLLSKKSENKKTVRLVDGQGASRDKSLADSDSDLAKLIRKKKDGVRAPLLLAGINEVPDSQIEMNTHGSRLSELVKEASAEGKNLTGIRKLFSGKNSGTDLAETRLPGGIVETYINNELAKVTFPFKGGSIRLDIETKLIGSAKYFGAKIYFVPKKGAEVRVDDSSKTGFTMDELGMRWFEQEADGSKKGLLRTITTYIAEGKQDEGYNGAFLNYLRERALSRGWNFGNTDTMNPAAAHLTLKMVEENGIKIEKLGDGERQKIDLSELQKNINLRTALPYRVEITGRPKKVAVQEESVPSKPSKFSWRNIFKISEGAKTPNAKTGGSLARPEGERLKGLPAALDGYEVYKIKRTAQDADKTAVKSSSLDEDTTEYVVNIYKKDNLFAPIHDEGANRYQINDKKGIIYLDKYFPNLPPGQNLGQMLLEELIKDELNKGYVVLGITTADSIVRVLQKMFGPNAKFKHLEGETSFKEFMNAALPLDGPYGYWKVWQGSTNIYARRPQQSGSAVLSEQATMEAQGSRLSTVENISTKTALMMSTAMHFFALKGKHFFEQVFASEHQGTESLWAYLFAVFGGHTVNFIAVNVEKVVPKISGRINSAAPVSEIKQEAGARMAAHGIIGRLVMAITLFLASFAATKAQQNPKTDTMKTYPMPVRTLDRWLDRSSADISIFDELNTQPASNNRRHKDIGPYFYDSTGLTVNDEAPARRYRADPLRSVTGRDYLPGFDLAATVTDKRKSPAVMLKSVEPLNPEFKEKFSNQSALAGIDSSGLEMHPANVNADLQMQHRMDMMLATGELDDAFVIVTHGHFAAGAVPFVRAKKDGRYLFDVAFYIPAGQWVPKTFSAQSMLDQQYQLWSETIVKEYELRKASGQTSAKGQVWVLNGHRGRLEENSRGIPSRANIDPYALFGSPEKFKEYLKSKGLKKVVIVTEESTLDISRIYDIPLIRLKDGSFSSNNEDLYPFFSALDSLIPVHVRTGDERPYGKGALDVKQAEEDKKMLEKKPSGARLAVGPMNDETLVANFGLDLSQLEELGFEESSIRRFMSAGEFVGDAPKAYQLEGAGQIPIISAELKKLISRKVAANDKSLTIYNVGLGREPRELKQNLEMIFSSLDEALGEEEAKTWKISFVAADMDPNALDAADAYFSELRQGGLGEQVSLQTVSANFLDSSDLAKVLAKGGKKADVIFHRYVSYLNDGASKGYFDPQTIKSDKSFHGWVLNAYLQTKNVFSVFASKGTLYVTEPVTIRNKGKAAILSGTTVVGEPWAGIYTINDPGTLAGQNIKEFLAVINSSGLSAKETDAQLSAPSAEVIADTRKTLAGISENFRGIIWSPGQDGKGQALLIQNFGDVLVSDEAFRAMGALKTLAMPVSLNDSSNTALELFLTPLNDRPMPPALAGLTFDHYRPIFSNWVVIARTDADEKNLTQLIERRLERLRPNVFGSRLAEEKILKRVVGLNRTLAYLRGSSKSFAKIAGKAQDEISPYLVKNETPPLDSLIKLILHLNDRRFKHEILRAKLIYGYIMELEKAKGADVKTMTLHKLKLATASLVMDMDAWFRVNAQTNEKELVDSRDDEKEFLAPLLKAQEDLRAWVTSEGLLKDSSTARNAFKEIVRISQEINAPFVMDGSEKRFEEILLLVENTFGGGQAKLFDPAGARLGQAVKEIFDATGRMIGADIRISETLEIHAARELSPLDENKNDFIMKIYRNNADGSLGERLDAEQDVGLGIAPEMMPGVSWNESADLVQLFTIYFVGDAQRAGIGRAVINWLRERALVMGKRLGTTQTSTPAWAHLILGALEPGSVVIRRADGKNPPTVSELEEILDGKPGALEFPVIIEGLPRKLATNDKVSGSRLSAAQLQTEIKKMNDIFLINVLNLIQGLKLAEDNKMKESDKVILRNFRNELDATQRNLFPRLEQNAVPSKQSLADFIAAMDGKEYAQGLIKAAVILREKIEEWEQATIDEATGAVSGSRLADFEKFRKASDIETKKRIDHLAGLLNAPLKELTSEQISEINDLLSAIGYFPMFTHDEKLSEAVFDHRDYNIYKTMPGDIAYIQSQDTAAGQIVGKRVTVLQPPGAQNNDTLMYSYFDAQGREQFGYQRGMDILRVYWLAQNSEAANRPSHLFQVGDRVAVVVDGDALDGSVYSINIRERQMEVQLDKEIPNETGSRDTKGFFVTVTFDNAGESDPLMERIAPLEFDSQNNLLSGPESAHSLKSLIKLFPEQSVDIARANGRVELVSVLKNIVQAKQDGALTNLSENALEEAVLHFSEGLKDSEGIEAIRYVLGAQGSRLGENVPTALTEELKTLEGDPALSMEAIRDAEEKLIVTELNAMPDAPLRYPIENLPMLSSQGTNSKVYMGTAVIDGVLRPAVVKTFSYGGLEKVLEYLIFAQIRGNMGIGPKFYGVVKDKNGKIIGYAMELVRGSVEREFDADTGSRNPEYDSKHPDILEIRKRLDGAGMAAGSDFMKTPDARFVAIDEDMTVIEQTRGLYDAYLKRSNQSGARLADETAILKSPELNAQDWTNSVYQTLLPGAKISFEPDMKDIHLALNNIDLALKERTGNGLYLQGDEILITELIMNAQMHRARHTEGIADTKFEISEDKKILKLVISQPDSGREDWGKLLKSSKLDLADLSDADSLRDANLAFGGSMLTTFAARAQTAPTLLVYSRNPQTTRLVTTLYLSLSGARLTESGTSSGDDQHSLALGAGLSKRSLSAVDVQSAEADQKTKLLLAQLYLSRSKGIIGKAFHFLFDALKRNTTIKFVEADGKVSAQLYAAPNGLLGGLEAIGEPIDLTGSLETARTLKLQGAVQPQSLAEDTYALVEPATTAGSLTRFGLKVLANLNTGKPVILSSVVDSRSTEQEIASLLEVKRAIQAYYPKAYFEFLDEQGNPLEGLPSDMLSNEADIKRVAIDVLTVNALEQAAKSGSNFFLPLEEANRDSKETGVLPLASVFIAAILVGTQDAKTLAENDRSVQFMHRLTGIKFDQKKFESYADPSPAKRPLLKELVIKRIGRIAIDKILQFTKLALKAIGSAA